MPEITLAKYAGFCFGVKHAVDTVEKLLTQNPDARIYTLGKLIHNSFIVDSFASRGVGIIEEKDIDRVAQESDDGTQTYVVVRAHGVVKSTLDKLKINTELHKNFHFEDCTCPNVSKIHKIAEDNTTDSTIFIMIGSPEHPEVKSIVSYARGDVLVFENSECLKDYADGENGKVFGEKQLILAAQTTQNLYEWEKCQKILQKLCTNPIIFDTICGVTEMRQTEVKRLASENDAVVVIGGLDSSNSNKLYQVSKEINPNSFFIQDSSQIEQTVFSPFSNVAITAGASTPGIIIQEVLTKMSELDFATLLEESLKSIHTGDIVTGTVLSISQNEIAVDLGCKFTGIIPYDEITDTAGVDLATMFKIGDEVEAVALRVSEVDGVATLSKKKLDAKKNFQNFTDAQENNTVFEGKVVEVIKGNAGVSVSCNLVRVFVPASQTGLPKDSDLTQMLGTTVKFKVIEVNAARRRVVGSIKSVIYEERKAAEDAFWAELEVGKYYKGKVVKLDTYGAFVLLGDTVQGLLHISQLSWRRIKHPSEVLSVGEEIEVFIRSLDTEKRHISLGYKTEDTNPWKIIPEKYNVGDIINVKITAVIDNLGAFAEVVPGQDGLIHISQISKERVEKTSDKLAVGDVVDAKITAIDVENRKVSLSIRAIIEDAEKATAAEAEAEAEEAVEAEETVEETDAE